MNELPKNVCGCTEPSTAAHQSGPGLEMLPIYRPVETDVPCCGPPAGPPSDPHERPGYSLCSFVKRFIETPVGAVPQVRPALDLRDRLGTAGVRLGIGRNDYKVAPGLYAVGDPDSRAAVIVTSNYKLTFDTLRRSLAGAAVWMLVLDTRGINVWCAAGKGTFSTDEVVRRVQATRLAQLVDHRRLILPQLGATGVAAHQVKRRCGFEVVWGPVRAVDLKAFLSAASPGDAQMRRVTFTLAERAVLVPVEIVLLRKYLLWALAALFVLSGIGPSIFTLTAAWHRGLAAAQAAAAGVIAGAVLVPILLPWIPGRAFAVKGGLAGALLGVSLVVIHWGESLTTPWSAAALILWTAALSSFLAMNFTGCTPFTSPSGVEKEMRRAIPLQTAAVVIAALLWVGAAF